MRLEDWCGGQCQADHDDTAGVLHGYYLLIWNKIGWSEELKKLFK